MTYTASGMQDFKSLRRGRSSWRPAQRLQGLLCAFTLILGTPVGLWLLYDRPTNTSSDVPGADPQASSSDAWISQARTSKVSDRPLEADAKRSAGSATFLVAVTPPLRRYLATLLDPSITSGVTPTTFARSAPLRAGFQPLRPPVIVAEAAPTLPEPPAVAAATAGPSAEEPNVLPLPVVPAREIPMPRPRPGSFLPAYEVATHASALPRVASQADKPAAPAKPAEGPSFFQRLFGGAREPSTVLAYAAPEDGGLGGRGLGGFLVNRASPDRTTAVYNIATHTVTLPDGSKLEAHSGLGASLDDPRSVTQHMRGATPPNVYDLEPRAAPFHGVRALRLNPIGGTTYGRLGLLAHTYMLGPRGDSNGCVVFKNYQAFLSAYEGGKVTRLAVVAGLN